MKRILVLATVFILAGAVSLYAQDKLLVSVPFEFTSVSGTLPAGDYAIRIDSSRGVIFINGQAGQGSAFVLGYPVSRTLIAEVITRWQPGPTGSASDSQNQKGSGTLNRHGNSGENCVVFNRYGDQYFLREIWTGYRGHHMTMSKAEKTIRMAGIVKPQRLEFAAVVR